MAERPILFSGPMVRAILDGRKTQTRRLLRDQQPIDLGASMHGAHLSRRAVHDHGELVGHRLAYVNCPYGVPGDRLWVRETTAIWPGHGLVYTADDDAAHYELKKRPAIHMPRTDSRLTLEVTGVRVERLQEITGADAIAEGLSVVGNTWSGEPLYAVVPHREYDVENGLVIGAAEYIGAPQKRNPIEAFTALWQSINAKRAPWASNPWVWVVEFKRH